jgi:hypothetical protein
MLWKAPRRIPAVLSRMKEADSIARRIAQVRFTPKPRLILRPGLELKTCSRELLHCGVKIFKLEVDDNAVSVRHMGYSV